MPPRFCSLGFALFLYVFNHLFLLFLTLKNIPSRSRGSASGVKEKCVRGQGEVCLGTRKSASGVKEKCFRWIPHIPRKHFSLSPDALLLAPWRTSPWLPTQLSLTPDALFLDPWGTSPWPGGLIFQSWKKKRKGKQKIQKCFWKRYIS